MSETSKPQDTAKSTAPEKSETDNATPVTNPAATEVTGKTKATADVVSSQGAPAASAPGAPAAAAPALADSATESNAKVTAAEKRRARRAAAPEAARNSSNSAKIKLGDAPDDATGTMRPASRMPKLPSDEEIAQSLAKSVTDSGADGAEPQESSAADGNIVRASAGESARRQAAMEKAANTKPVLTRVFQVLIAAFYPIVLLVLAIRLVTSSVFLWVEYHRPGFPADQFGFTTDDRITYGSYTVDYLLNFTSPRYLGGLVNSLGGPLFLTREVDHMADVKSVITMAFVTGLVLAVIMIIGMVYLSRRSFGGNRRALFAGSIVTLVLIVALGVFALTGWERFFTDFHEVFFANGTWTFYTDDTLIRLFPSEFWMDSGIFIGGFVFMVSSLTLAFTWPTKDRRLAVAAAKRPGRRAA